MKTYVRYSMAVLVGGLLLGLIGCGSSNSSCSSGETMTTNGCGTGSCTVPGTNQTGAIVGSTCYALSGSATSTANCSIPGDTAQSVPAPYNTEIACVAAAGGVACCPTGINLSAMPQEIESCQCPSTGASSSCVPPMYWNGYECI